MMKYIHLLAFLSLGLAVTSCHKKTRVEEIQEFRLELTSEDTVSMLKMCDDCMESLKAGKIDEVIGSLREYNDSTNSISPLTPETEAAYRKKFQLFPVHSYKRAYYSFQLEGCNDVKYEVEFAETDNVQETGEYKTNYMFNPVKIDGVWYLTMKTETQSFDKSRQ